MPRKKAIDKPTLFIAVSGKSASIAEAIKLNFDKEADVDIWTENVFHINEGTLESLMNRASYYDFFIAVFAADDVAIINKKKKNVTRDNVIFEFGLFLGRIGLNRTFFVLEEGVELFSDWNGVTTTSFKRRENLVSALGTSCIKIREKMKIAEDLFKYTILPSTALAIGYYHNFLEEILHAFNNQKSIQIILERDKAGKATRTIDYEIKKPYPTIEIRVPHDLSALKKDVLTIKTSDYKQIIINAPSRPYPFYIHGEFDADKPIKIFDIPTTLFTSYLTIQAFFKDSFLKTQGNERKLNNKEIKNFQQTLSKLIPDGVENKFYKFIVY